MATTGSFSMYGFNDCFDLHIIHFALLQSNARLKGTIQLFIKIFAIVRKTLVSHTET